MPTPRTIAKERVPVSPVVEQPPPSVAAAAVPASELPPPELLEPVAPLLVPPLVVSPLLELLLLAPPELLELLELLCCPRSAPASGGAGQSTGARSGSSIDGETERISPVGFAAVKMFT